MKELKGERAELLAKMCDSLQMGTVLRPWQIATTAAQRREVQIGESHFSTWQAGSDDLSELCHQIHAYHRTEHLLGFHCVLGTGLNGTSEQIKVSRRQLGKGL